ncbi:MAG: outer membrane protein assembly factor [Planctomycetaceae bacterium]
MTGVRRVRRTAPTRTACRLIPPCLLLAVWLTACAGPVRAQSADDVFDETPRESSTATAAPQRKLPKSIKDTALPSNEVDDDLPGGASDDTANRRPKSLTGRDEVVEISEPLANVVIEGNRTIATDEITKRIKTRPGRLPDADQVKDDVKALYATRWFFRIENEVRQTPEGPELVFKVVERPIVKSVEYKGVEGSWVPGSKKRELKHLGDLTGLKTGSGFDVGTNQEAARRIESYFQEKGYIYAKVTLEEGDQPEHRNIIFVIDKGPKVHVDRIEFAGNEFFDSGTLKTQLKTKKRFLWLFGGKYDPATLPEDIGSLKGYYHSVGFFDVKLRQEISQSEDRASVKIVYHVTEGQRYKVNKIEFDGNRVIPAEELAKNMKLQEQQFFNERQLTADVDKMVNQYGELGRIFAQVNPTPKFSEAEGTLDLVFQIDEDRPWKIGRIRVHIQGDHPHTKETVVRNRLPFRTGDMASRNLIKRGEQRLAGSQVFAGAAPGSPDRPQIVVAPAEWLEEATAGAKSKSKVRQARFQAADEFDETRERRPGVLPNGQRANETLFDEAVRQGETRRSRSSRPHFDLPPVFQPESLDDTPILRGQNPEFEGSLEEGLLGESSPLGGNPATYDDVPPDYLDVDVFARDTQTGRLNIGVAVNSNQGVVGTFVLEENNFDLFRPPTSWADIANGTAWRGGAQQFRIEAVPGAQVSRYLVSWRDPYFLDQNFSLGVSGFYYQRFFPNWNEQRLGGRVAVGQQINSEWSTSVALRLEDVGISNPSRPTPQALEEALGHSFLSTVRGSIVHDTRDSPFMAGSGHYFELGYEQGFGEWVYPKIDLEAKQYFTLYERPTGGHRQILSVTGNVGWAGDDTPIFERYYAGGFQSFRGFAFYGVTPRESGVRTGGTWQTLGSVEYLLPITADDMIQVVAFSDFGTVDSEVSLDNFRVAVGTGLRLTIPMMGPVPIALDFGIPLVKQDYDNTQVFAFYLGVQR